ncbi:MAG TPA: tRNA (adenosine(37)-N6)-threonylcarbamoyltransferase complex transferase subunit TsaD, partial [Armatimonadota bacterium]
VAAAKALALVLKVPLVGVHHLEAHIYANLLVKPDLQFPLLCLIVSGGHSDLALMRGHGQYEMLGRTRDDAAGEAFDKIARALGLGYPGGPIVDRIARQGNPAAYPFPRANLGETLDFSYSGLKTALLTFLRQRGVAPVSRSSKGVPQSPSARDVLTDQEVADVAASFQEAIVDPLVTNAGRAVLQTGATRVLLCGGVAANSRLRAKMQEAGARLGFEVHYPPILLCTDNAAMSACAGYYRLVRGEQDGLDLETFAAAPLGS